MPIYSYVCGQCGSQRDQFARVDERHTSAPDCHGQMTLEIMPTMVSPDISTYVAVAGDMAGKPITSRREHREFLKRNRFVEVGNEPIRPIKNNFRPKRGEIADELKRVIPQVMARR